MDYETVIRQAVEKLGYSIDDASAPQGVGITADGELKSAEDLILEEADVATEGIGGDLHITSPDRWSESEGGQVGGGFGGRDEAFTVDADTAGRFLRETRSPDDAAYVIAELLNSEKGFVSRIISDESGSSSGTTTVALRWDAQGRPDGSVVVYLTPSVDRGEIGPW